MLDRHLLKIHWTLNAVLSRGDLLGVIRAGRRHICLPNLEILQIWPHAFLHCTNNVGIIIIFIKFSYMCEDIFFYRMSYTINLFCYGIIMITTYLLFLTGPTADNLLLNSIALQFLVEIRWRIGKIVWVGVGALPD